MPPPEPPVKKTTAEWVLLLLGIDVNRCPRRSQQTLQRTTLLPVRMHLPNSAGAPPTQLRGHDTS